MKYYWLSAVALIGLLTLAQGQTAPAPLEWGPGIKVLIVGGGAFHNYGQWDNKFDTATLQKAGITSVHYSENEMVAARELPHVDVLVMSNNRQGFDKPPFREAVSNFVNAGKGLVLRHSGVWYNWGWTEYNALLVGGGARDHDGVSQFDETIVKEHPVTHGLPATFKMTDELYHVVHDPAGSPIEVLAEAAKPGAPKYPSVWLVHNGKARIVCIALGHDGAPRQSLEFSTLLVNAVNWAGGH